MALNLAARAAVVVVVLALTMGQPAAEDCGECSHKCVNDCLTEASDNCKNICGSLPEICDTCQATEWKECATKCYADECHVATTATQCPLQTTMCNVCDETCPDLCNDVDQGLCDGECVPPTGTASSPECDSCKKDAVKSCATACRANLCVLLLSCPRMV